MLTISTLLRALYVVCCCCCCCVAAAAESLQSCPTLCDPIDGSPPGSTVPGILQPRTLEWVAISFSSAWKWKVKVKSLSCVWLLATSWTAAYQAPPSMGFSRQEYWSGLPLPSPVCGLTHFNSPIQWVLFLNSNILQVGNSGCPTSTMADLGFKTSLATLYLSLHLLPFLLSGVSYYTINHYTILSFKHGEASKMTSIRLQKK